MSRTYRKYIRLGNCCGSNTEWYRDKNRERRAKRKMRLRKIREMNVTDFDNYYYEPKIIRKDTWREPTDGCWCFSKKDIGMIAENIKRPKYPWDREWAERIWHKYVVNLKYYHQNKPTKPF